MAKHERELQLKAKLDIENDIDDDTDDEDYDPIHDAKKKRKIVELEEHAILVQAMQKCEEVRKDIKNFFNTKHLETNSTQNATKDKKFVSKVEVNAACDILDNDYTREIKPYQIGGINFLLVLHRLHIGGAILADEMGLGKTIQVITFLGVLKHLDGNLGPHLVVAPISVLENWKQEIAKWCPFFNVIVYQGSKKEDLCKKLSHMVEKGDPTPFNILITSYSIFEGKSTQMKKDRNFLRMWDWNCVIMDEGHLLKDSTSFRNKRLQEIVYKAKQRIMLTGTPIQNDLQELWSLLSFMMPDTFSAYGKDLQDFFGTKNHNTQDQILITKMQILLKPFVIRRTKSKVLSCQQLQSKSHCVVKVNMIDSQAQAYKEAILRWQTYVKSIITNERNIFTIDNSNCQGIPNALTRKELSNFFTYMRKISNHPLLVRRLYTDEAVKKLAKGFFELKVFGNQCIEKQIYNRLLSYNDFTLHKLCEEYSGIFKGPEKLSDEIALSSAKCKELAKLLPKLKEEGHRCLIFSQWTMILDILEWVLNVLGYKFIRLDGSTNIEVRQTLVDEYNNNQDIFIFLISTRAGGQGLNLIGADTVIIHDVDFNPQIDRQAEDRCHRIGQLKPVTIYRLVANNSVDESIYDIARKKLNLDAAMLQTGYDSSHDELQIMGQYLLEKIHQ